MKLDQDQRIALARVNEGKNVFITGAAGTGKSSVTTEVIRRRIGDRSLKVCATTGVAALNLRDKLKAITGEPIPRGDVEGAGEIVAGNDDQRKIVRSEQVSCDQLWDKSQPKRESAMKGIRRAG